MRTTSWSAKVHDDQAGYEVADAGDVDGDGLGDVSVIGAPNQDSGEVRRQKTPSGGATYVLLSPNVCG